MNHTLCDDNNKNNPVDRSCPSQARERAHGSVSGPKVKATLNLFNMQTHKGRDIYEEKNEKNK